MISFRHATVLACTGADPVDDATVIVEGAVIKDVLTSAREATRGGGEVIDCRGRTVMPGLIDAHVHVCAVEVDLAARTSSTRQQPSSWRPAGPSWCRRSSRTRSCTSRAASAA
jgi:imidazolonepropionase-like amidohydrolase